MYIDCQEFHFENIRFTKKMPLILLWHVIYQILMCRPVAPGWVMIADIGMVLMMVVPCLVVAGETPLMLRIVGLFPVPPAWDVVMIVVGLPSAEVTSFSMVPAGSEPFV